MSVQTLQGQADAVDPRAGVKVPRVNTVFWVMKICATTLGETAGDLLSMTMGVGYARSSIVLVAVFATVLAAQMATRRLHPALYWGVVLATSTAGTTMSDFMDRTLGLGYAAGAAILTAILASIFVLWRLTGTSFSVDRVTAPGAEALYWSAILFSNTLGTALGDFLSDSSGLGFAGGAALIGGLLAVLVVAALFTSASRVLLFWLAFVLTRPFGATMGDVLTKPLPSGGLGFGTLGSSAVLAVVLVSLVAYQVVAQPGRGARAGVVSG